MQGLQVAIYCRFLKTQGLENLSLWQRLNSFVHSERRVIEKDGRGGGSGEVGEEDRVIVASYIWKQSLLINELIITDLKN